MTHLKVIPQVSKFYTCSFTRLKNDVLTGGKSHIHVTRHVAAR